MRCVALQNDKNSIIPIPNPCAAAALFLKRRQRPRLQQPLQQRCQGARCRAFIRTESAFIISFVAKISNEALELFELEALETSEFLEGVKGIKLKS